MGDGHNGSEREEVRDVREVLAEWALFQVSSKWVYVH